MRGRGGRSKPTACPLEITTAFHSMVCDEQATRRHDEITFADTEPE